ncbi:MAG TPA: DUF6158 family protein [Mycobacteriales bacterium]|nr:DUF6158 family protein [Mycobacteriales bacterium]
MTENHVTLAQVKRRSAPDRSAANLSEQELRQELEHLHATRHEMFLHASAQAMVAHSERQHALEDEYLRRHPDREIDPGRLSHPERG